ncbi:hypothetical protein C8035_v003518 [Colletotrichum spinosum]|uniref:Uncharacterized protein n=1 Tax=Colletotrichum spinosum TaxID=1347390 RepID=A0A4R8Q4G4_9PEZI|nr:hypothetical protein C8035_v003518 [Colletotrichum spinosum]
MSCFSNEGSKKEVLKPASNDNEAIPKMPAQQPYDPVADWENRPGRVTARNGARCPSKDIIPFGIWPNYGCGCTLM